MFFKIQSTLDGDDYIDIMRRFAEHLISNKDFKTAVFVFISLKLYLKAIQTLIKFDIEKAVLFAAVCIKRQVIDIRENKEILENLFDKYCNNLENSGLDQSVDYFKQLFKIND